MEVAPPVAAGQSGPLCRVEMLGGLRVVQAGGRVISRFRTYKTGALLAYLAYYPRPHPREALIEMLWPECEPDAGRNSLSKALSSLRNQLEPPGVAPAGTVLVADRSSVLLSPQAVATDVAAFEAALLQAKNAGHAAALLMEAAERYGGELLPGYYEHWNLTERQRLADAYVDVLGRLVGRLTSAGDTRRALPWAHRAVAADPLREESHAALIRAYLAGGEPAAARRQYQELERLLEKDTGARPSRAVRALIRDLPQNDGETKGEGDGAGANSAVSAPSPPLPPTPQQAPASAPLSTAAAGTLTVLLAEAAPAAETPDTAAALGERLGDLARRQGGQVIGDAAQANAASSLAFLFGRASDAVACAVAGQRAFPAASSVRMALHTGEVGGDDVTAASFAGGGLVAAHAARLLLAAHPGQTLCSEATAALLRRDAEPGLRLLDLGLWRLPGSAGTAATSDACDDPAAAVAAAIATAPERLFDIVWAGRAVAAFPPPLLAAPGLSDTLPLSLNRFFGRADELARLRALLVGGPGSVAGGPMRAFPDHHRLVTLTGTGGTGKTRLSLEAGRSLLAGFGGAVFFVPLADVFDGRLVLDAVRAGLGLPEGVGTTGPARLLAQVTEALRNQPAGALLILDNFEQLLRDDDPHAADAALQTVRALLEKVPSLVVLVSSRQRLGLAGEREFPVAPLPTPAARAPGAGSDGDDGGDSAQQVAGFASVQLFVDRAQAVQPDFQVTPGNARAVAALCERLEGLPLALELAAARAPVLSPVQMLAQLERRFDFLVSRQRDAVLRHRTIRAAIDWSYQLLSPDLQRFFAALSVFRGGWTWEAADAVTSEPLALDYLAQLSDHSLVRSEPAGAGGETRFRMLETLRQYADERLEKHERAGLRARHAAYFVNLAERARPALAGPDQNAWLDRLEADHDNLRAVLDGAATGEVESVGAGLRVAGAVWRFWWVRGYLSEGRERLRTLLDQPGARDAALANYRAHACVAAGALARMQGELAEARARLSEGADLFRALNDEDGIAQAENSLGNLAWDQSDYDAARTHYEKSLMLRERRGERGAVATALNNLGNTALFQGDYERAARLAEQALALRRDLGDAVSIAQSLNNAGLIARYRNDAARARALLAESQHRFEALGDTGGMAAALNNLGEVAFDQNDLDRAGEHFAQSLAFQRERGDKAGTARSLGILGRIAFARGERAEARRLQTESLLLRRDLSDREGLAHALVGFAELAAAAGDRGGTGRAVVLLGAAQALRAAQRAPLPPVEQARFDQAAADLRARLGDAAFGAAWDEGTALSLGDAVARALAEAA